VFNVCENNQFLKKWIMIIILNLHSGTKLSGWLLACWQAVRTQLVNRFATTCLQTCNNLCVFTCVLYLVIPDLLTQVMILKMSSLKK
jgi:hypothetical protein